MKTMYPQGGAAGETAIAPKSSDTLTLSPPRGHILLTISEVTAKFSGVYVLENKAELRHSIGYGKDLLNEIAQFN